jgi:hypothetical protein
MNGIKTTAVIIAAISCLVGAWVCDQIKPEPEPRTAWCTGEWTVTREATTDDGGTTL